MTSRAEPIAQTLIFSRAMSRITDTECVLVERMRRRRIEIEMTQSELSAALAERGVWLSQSALSRIEAGMRRLYVGDAIEIARALGIELLWMQETVDKVAIIGRVRT
jgi:transcriptional regulator with XRE-family HTH domain